jgi:elongation factor G
MLYHAGFITSIGNVDEGSTVTDFLKTERERGITINSACISFNWLKNSVNLVDTPGHVDFTIEVERSLRVLDGAITILDAVAGVEAQTETVWRQANSYQISRIAFINKMDRPGASFTSTLEGMHRRLIGWGKAVPIHLPLFKSGLKYSTNDHTGGVYCGSMCLVNMQTLEFNAAGELSRNPIEKSQAVYQQALNARGEMLESLAEHDEDILQDLLDKDMNAELVSPENIQKSLRKLTIDGKVVPTLCGAAFRNIGVQPLLVNVLM